MQPDQGAAHRVEPDDTQVAGAGGGRHAQDAVDAASDGVGGTARRTTPDGVRSVAPATAPAALATDRARVLCVCPRRLVPGST